MNKRILLVGNFLSHANGTCQVCEELALRLPDLGWDVLYTSSKENRVTRAIDKIWTTWRERSNIAVAQIDVFRRPAFHWAEAATRILRRVGKPCILTLHSGDLPELARRSPRRVTRLLQSATAVTAPSRYLVEQMRHCRDDIVLIPNPLDISRYRFAVRKPPRPYLTWLRSFKKLYNPSMAIKVASLLRRQFPDIHLVMIGPDTGDGSLSESREVADDLAMVDRVSFPGHVAKHEVPEWIGQSDIFLNTTNVDNTPVSVIEAMACGLCVVSTNVGGIPHLLADGHNALLVPPNNPDTMASAVRRILTDHALAARLSRNARETAKQFDWSVVLPQWDALLTTAAANGRP